MMPSTPAPHAVRRRPAGRAVLFSGLPTGRAMVLLWAVLLSAVLLSALLLAGSGCGLRSNPVPLSTIIPENQDIAAWFREKSLVISWRAPEDRLVQRWGSVVSYTLFERVHPLACPACPPFATTQTTLRPDAPGLTREGLRMYYAVVPEVAPGLWEIQLKTRYRSGENAPTAPVIVTGLSQTPLPELSAQVLPGGGQLRLFWPPYRDRVVQRITATGGQVESALYFRANIYRRVPPAPFPMTPLNVLPVDDLQLIVPLQAARLEPVEYTLRLVDQFGNEGPPAPPVSPPAPVAAPPLPAAAPAATPAAPAAKGGA